MTQSKKIAMIILNTAKRSNNMIEWCVVLDLISKEVNEMSRKLAEVKHGA